MRTRRVWLAAAAMGALLVAGCGRDERKSLSPACREGPESVLRALRTAPRAVSLDGVSLSSCIRDASDSGELTDLGSSYLEAVSRLTDESLRHPHGRAPVQLGYLIGAIRRGRVEEQGVSVELVRRLTDEARRADVRSAGFRRGERAGRAAG